MRVTVVESAESGEKTIVRSGTGEWPATWCGTEPAVSGQDYDVEIEIDEIESWCDDSAASERRSGIFHTNDSLVACGSVSVAYDDGVFVLNLEPGSIMVEPGDISRSVKQGQFVCFAPSSVSVFPEGI